MTDASPRAPRRWLNALFQPVDISSLVLFRIAAGALMFWEIARYLKNGWVRLLWIEPQFHFTYPFFGWVKPWPGDGMIIHCWILVALSLLIMLGACYRVSTALFFLGFTYLFLIDQAHYLNHFYLISLVSFLLIFIPAHRKHSVDALLRPHLRSETVSAWAVWLLRFQIGVPYFFGGIAKINVDWLQGEPVRYWLQARTALPVVGRFFNEPAAPYVVAYGGMLLDLFVVPLLLWRKTRLLAFVFSVVFHLTNDALFNIGVFPWFMIAATTVFFEPDWPRRLLADLLPRPTWRGVASVLGGIGGAIAVLAVHAAGAVTATQPSFLPFIPALVGAAAGALIVWTLAARLDASPKASGKKSEKGSHARAPKPVAAQRPHPASSALTRTHALSAGLLAAWVFGQVAMPLRHFFVPGPVNWTEEGHQFAWHMMLRTKLATLRYQVIDRTDGTRWQINANELLAQGQTRKVASNPRLVHQFALYLDKEIAANGRPDVEIRALTQVSLNGRTAQPIIDSSLDLASLRPPLWHAPWILPLTGDLPEPGTAHYAEAIQAYIGTFAVPLTQPPVAP